MRDSFIFYRSFYEAIKDLPRDIQGEIYTAIMEYSLYGKETDNLKPIARSIFTLIKPQIDVNNKRFSNGCKGGRPKSDNQNKTKSEPKQNQNKTKVKPNENVNDNVNENDNYIPPIVPQGDDGHHEERIDYNALMNTFNQMFNSKLSKVISMTDKRKQAVRARVSEHGKQAIMTVFQNILQSPFLLGHNDKNWSCDFDWIFRPTNFIKILEGNYNGNRTNQRERDSQQRRVNSAIAVATRVQEAAAKSRAALKAEGVID